MSELQLARDLTEFNRILKGANSFVKHKIPFKAGCTRATFYRPNPLLPYVFLCFPIKNNKDRHMAAAGSRGKTSLVCIQP